MSFNAGLWGTGVNVFFNESWDHDAHIELSYYYFVAAGFNNVFLYFAMLPRIWAEHRAPLVRHGVVQLAFHGVWISLATGFLYQWVYQDWTDKPGGALGVYEHSMSAYQLVSFGIVLHWFLRPPAQEAAAQEELSDAPALALARADGSGVGGIDLGFMAAKCGGAGLGAPRLVSGAE